MVNKFSELRSRMSPKSRARSAIKAQTMLAEVLRVQQPSIAKLVSRARPNVKERR